MAGKIILMIKKFVHQHFLCIHKPKIVHRKDLQGGSFEKCENCDLIL